MKSIEQEAEKKQSVETIKVLIADDDPPTRILLKAAISQWGYTVIEAKDGEEAWNTLQTPNAPRILILDWLMPKLDGIALCERIKNELNAQHPYIILLTQVTGTTNIIKGLEAGADEFLSKPFNMAELRSRLSVGARIIKFEAALSKQVQLTKNYLNEIEVLISLVKEITVLCKDSITVENPQATSEQSQLMKNLCDKLTHINQVIHDFEQKSKGNI